MKPALRSLAFAFVLTAAILRAQSPAPAAPISAERIKETSRICRLMNSSAEAPARPGDEKTVAYLADAFAKAGLEPGGENGTFFQEVPLVRLERQPGATMSLKVGGKAIPLALGRNATLGLRNPERTTVTDAPLVFAGYGIVDARAAGMPTKASK
jgi:hypothetical protein